MPLGVCAQLVCLLLRALYVGPRVGAPLRAHRRAEAKLHTATPRRPAPLQHTPPRCTASPSPLTAGDTQTRMRARVSAAALWAPLRSTMSRYARRSATPHDTSLLPTARPLRPALLRDAPLRPATPRYRMLRPATHHHAPASPAT